MSRGPSSVNVAVQNAGFVYKLPFRKQTSGSWKKRYFVIKDGYLLYYTSPKPESINKFDIHPKGVLPLGATTVEKYSPSVPPPPGYFAFKVSHESFAKGSLVAAVESEEARQKWLEVLKRSSRVTWDNAILGDQLITELRQKGTSMLKKKNALLKNAKEEAKTAEQLREELEQREQQLQELVALQEVKAREAEAIAQQRANTRQEREALQARIAEVNARTSSLESARTQLEQKASQARMEVDEVSQKLERMGTEARMLLEEAEESTRQLRQAEEDQRRQEEKRERQLAQTEERRQKQLRELEEERKKREELEQKLRDAEASLTRLDTALRNRRNVNVDCTSDVKNLRSFFESRAQEITRQSARQSNRIRKSVEDLRVGNHDQLRAQKRAGASSATPPAVPEAIAVKVKAQRNAPSVTGEPAAPTATGETKLPAGVSDASEDSADEYVDSADEEDEMDPEVAVRGTALFQALDRDGDAILNFEEFNAGLDSGSLEMTLQIREELFSAMDRRNERAISLEDFVYYYNAYEDYLRDAFSGFVQAPSGTALEQAEWYYQDADGETNGPHDLEGLKAAVQEGIVLHDTHVWCEEIESWHELAEVAGLQELLA